MFLSGIEGHAATGSIFLNTITNSTSRKGLSPICFFSQKVMYISPHSCLFSSPFYYFIYFVWCLAARLRLCDACCVLRPASCILRLASCVLLWCSDVDWEMRWCVWRAAQDDCAACRALRSMRCVLRVVRLTWQTRPPFSFLLSYYLLFYLWVASCKITILSKSNHGCSIDNKNSRGSREIC